MCLTKGDEMKRYVIREIKELDHLIVRENMKNFVGKISIPQRMIGFYILEHENEPVYQRDLEKTFSIRRSTVSGILKTMEKNNLIKRISANNDARLKAVVLTNDAKKEFKEIECGFHKLNSLLVNGISDDELHTFFKVIDKMKENIK